MDRLLGKIERNRAEIDKYESLEVKDAQYLIVAIGISARAAARAVSDLRDAGIKAGLFRPITLWPFPEEAFAKASAKAKAILVPEMNAGQLVLEIQRLSGGGPRVVPLNRVDGEPIAPAQIASSIKELAKGGKK
jgi:2-oxoglutarate ferredoxin oxidoreductase subunit alpha